MNLDAYKQQLIEFASSLNKIPINSPSSHIYRGNNIEKFLDENYEIYINATADERKEKERLSKTMIEVKKMSMKVVLFQCLSVIC